MEKILNNKWLKIGLFSVAGLFLAVSLVFAVIQIGKQQAIRNTNHESRLTPAPLPTPTPTFELTPTPTSSIKDQTKDWEIFSNPKGYIIKYPKQFSLGKRVDGFYVFLEDSQNPMSVAFYIDDRGEKTLSERRDEIATNLVEPTFSDLGLPGLDGFIAVGITGPGYRQGEYTKAAYIDFRGKELVFGCELAFCKSEFFDQILSTFKFLD